MMYFCTWDIHIIVISFIVRALEVANEISFKMLYVCTLY